ncbi:MAG: glycosyltransferase, partial [Gemmatimonadetes bacterium]|nr:glycosyltransferase [Gemmatimonadota bacterium]
MSELISSRKSRRIVLLGMITKMPVPGVLWQTLHYMVGLQRLGYDVVYVEAHSRTPSMFTLDGGDHGSKAAARFLQRLFSRFGFGDRWALHALHADRACYGLTESQLLEAYQSSEILINLHGGTRPLPEHAETGRLVFLGTDPCQLEVELWQGREETREFLEAHCAIFTFGENYGNPDCRLPVSDRFELQPTRQPVVPDFWETDLPDNGLYTTVANWRQTFRQIRFLKEVYHWSKDREFLKILDLPERSGLRFELALSSFEEKDRLLLEGHGWGVREAQGFSTDLDPYRDYVRRSRGELTVAKDQNVRLKSGWFSDRSATYLAAGRPVVTQETGFSAVLPTGKGLFGFNDLEEANIALQEIEADYPAACRAAMEISREFFDYRVVLPALLSRVGVEGPRAPISLGGGYGGQGPFPPDLILKPESRRPLRLHPATLRTLLDRPVPGEATTDGEASGTRAELVPYPPGEASRRGPSASVVVVTLDNLSLTRLCLESLLAHTAYPDYEVVVVDNGSADGTTSYLRDLAAIHSRVRLILNPSNEGFARACNQGARVAVGDVLVFLNNDTVPAPGWLTGLVGHLGDPEVGAVNAVTNRIGTEAEVAEAPITVGEFLERARLRRERPGLRRRAGMLALFCLGLRRETWLEVGPLDEAYGQGLFEDDDYSVRLDRAGHGMWCAEDVLVHHFGEASFGTLVPDGSYSRLFEENRRRFEAKWGTRWEPRRGKDDGEYQELIGRVLASAGGGLPGGSTVAVVSRGDPKLLELEDATGWHFPMDPNGSWAGHYPADSQEAVALLEAIRRRGADHFLIPRHGFWWLEHYAGLERHLSRNAEEVLKNGDMMCWRLSRNGSPADACHPVFIIGSPRSGTSILTWSLGQHPNLYPLEETVWFGRFHKGLSDAFELGSSRGDKSQLSAQGISRKSFFRAFGHTVDRLVHQHREWPGTPLG